MAESNLNQTTKVYGSGKDGICIIRCTHDIPGGRTLDASRIPAEYDVISAGHIVIKKAGQYILLGVSGGKFASLTEGESYVGVLRTAIMRQDPRGAIVTAGQVNGACTPFPIDDAIIKGLPHIEFLFCESERGEAEPERNRGGM